ncbi:MAG: hypothetical protein R2844_08220 [Caldilineales bacterium]
MTSFVLGVTPRAGQVVSLLAGALTPVFTALLAYEVWSKDRASSGPAFPYAHAVPSWPACWSR